MFLLMWPRRSLTACSRHDVQNFSPLSAGPSPPPSVAPWHSAQLAEYSSRPRVA